MTILFPSDRGKMDNYDKDDYDPYVSINFPPIGERDIDQGEKQYLGTRQRRAFISFSIDHRV